MKLNMSILALVVVFCSTAISGVARAEPPVPPAKMDIIARVPPAQTRVVALDDAREMFRSGLGMVFFRAKDGGHAALSLSPNFNPGCEVKFKLVF